MLESVPLFAIILLIVGIILIVIEILMPGFGAFGVSGIIVLGISIFLTAKSIEQAALILLITIIIITFLTTLLIKQIINRKIKSPLVLYESLEQVASEMDYFIGKKGKSITDLRPAGKASFDGVNLDVMSSGVFIKEGHIIKVIKIDGNKIIVEMDNNEI